MRFVTIGYIEWRKGQDILIDAIEKLPMATSLTVEFLLIGQNTSLFAQELSERIKSMPNAKMLGTMEREKIHEIIDQTDLMICPSREDPMPTVCAEAMMHKVPCLVSDATGTAAYITDGKDGLVFKNENSQELSEKILWSIEHKEELPDMGERAFDIYERVFSEQVFEKKLLGYVEEMIGKAGC